MNTADQTAKAGCHASTTTGKWLYWRDTLPMQSDQLCSIGADMKSATSQSLSIYNWYYFMGSAIKNMKGIKFAKVFFCCCKLAIELGADPVCMGKKTCQYSYT